METVDARHLALIAILVLRFQEDGTKSRRQRQGVQCRDEDGNGHRHTELTIERTAGATDERHGDEHRCHHKGDGDDGARDFVHGIDGCSEGALIALVELRVHGLDHHDGIVHHNSNSQEQGR